MLPATLFKNWVLGVTLKPFMNQNRHFKFFFVLDASDILFKNSFLGVPLKSFLQWGKRIVISFFVSHASVDA